MKPVLSVAAVCLLAAVGCGHKPTYREALHTLQMEREELRYHQKLLDDAEDLYLQAKAFPSPTEEMKKCIANYPEERKELSEMVARCKKDFERAKQECLEARGRR